MPVQNFTKWFPAGFRLINGLTLSNWFNNPQNSTEDTITAFAGGGQANAYQLSAANSRVSVCATNGDSVKLPDVSKFAGCSIEIINDGAANLAVFPKEAAVTIDGGAGGASVTITTPKRADFYAINGAWYSSGGAKTT